MGIRLVCPQGHKLHVKAFLAGKRAICPHCGEKVMIPLADEQTASIAAAANPETTIDLADLPTKGPGARPTERVATAPNQAAPAVVPAAATNVSHAARPPVGEVTALVVAPAAPAAAPPPVIAAVGPTSDPIAENSGAVWYVRPKIGGQYGPAPGPMMRQWIAESRVAADSLVWREGWDQWRVARDVFVELGAGRTAAAAVGPLPVGGLVSSGAAVGPVVATGAPSPGAPGAAAVRYQARRRSTGRLVALIVMLGLLVVALAVVLVYVVQTRM